MKECPDQIGGGPLLSDAPCLTSQILTATYQQGRLGNSFTLSLIPHPTAQHAPQWLQGMGVRRVSTESWSHAEPRRQRHIGPFLHH